MGLYRSSEPDPYCLTEKHPSCPHVRFSLVRHKYGTDRLSEASLPWLVDLPSDENVDIATRALAGLSLNYARIEQDETDDQPLTMYRVTLPDGSVHERPSRTEE